MVEIDYLREGETGSGAEAGAPAAGSSGPIEERKWPLSVSMVIAVVVSVVLWAGIIVFVTRLWRWI